MAYKWQGRCPECEAWNTFVEEVEAAPSRSGVPGGNGASHPPRALTEIEASEEDRTPTGLGELDRVLGGGLVPGSLVLIGGAPGIGKSTLLLQAAATVAAAGGPVLYVTGEESLEQTKLRAARLGLAGTGILLLAEVNLEAILSHIEALVPALVIVDSIQSVYRPDLPSAPGSVGQVRECAAQLMRLGKSARITMLLVGHVTKDGSIAGPRVLEHLVDTVLYFEGDNAQHFRILRAVKNRFGSTNEVGLFEMESGGLKEIRNPSQFFLDQRPPNATGSVIVPILEGSRPLLVEVQALVSRSHFGLPARRSTGVDANRLLLLLAVLEKRAGVGLSNADVFVNVVGGLRIDEPAADLALAVAVAGSAQDRPVRPGTLVLGEVGLGGEVRSVTRLEARLQEGANMGFTRAVLPHHRGGSLEPPPGLSLAPVATLREALREALASAPGSGSADSFR